MAAPILHLKARKEISPGRVVVGTYYTRLRGRFWNDDLNPVIFLHAWPGSSNYRTILDQQIDSYVDALLDSGYTLYIPFTGSNWGTSNISPTGTGGTGQTAIAEAISAAGEDGMNTTRVNFFGSSMGALNAMRWIWENPNQFNYGFFYNPIVSIMDTYDTAAAGSNGARTSMLACYGAATRAELVTNCVSGNPIQNLNPTDEICRRMRICGVSTDTMSPSAVLTSFCTDNDIDLVWDFNEYEIARQFQNANLPPPPPPPSTPPSITSQPSNQTVTAPAQTSFTATASGNPIPSVQWQVNTGSGWNNVSTGSGGTTSTYTTPLTTTGMNGYQYRAVFTNSAGSATTSIVTLTVNSAPPSGAPTITSQPASQTVQEGQQASFVCLATGTPTPTVQWQVNTGSTWGSVTTGSGGTTQTYVTPVTTASMDGYQYRAVFTNTNGSVTSNIVTLTVNSLPVGDPGHPDPSAYWSDDFSTLNTATWGVYGPGNNETWGQGSPQLRTGFYSPNAVSVANSILTISMSPDVGGTNGTRRTAISGKPGWRVGFLDTTGKRTMPLYGRFKVCWRMRNSQVGFWPAALWMGIVPAGTSFSEIDEMEWFGNDYLNRVRINFHLPRDSGGSQVSNVSMAGFGVNANWPTSNDMDRDAWHTTEVDLYEETEGGDAIIDTYLDGVLMHRYDFGTTTDWKTRWRAGQTGWNLKICVQAEGAGGTVAPENVNSTFYLDVAYVEVKNHGTAPVITSQPSSQTVTAGQPVTFTALASGSPIPTVKWQSSPSGSSTWTDISGAISTSYTISTTTTAMTGNKYRAVFTNGSGSVTTNTATLTVNTATTPPTMAQQPTNQTALLGRSATFVARANGSPTPTVQWYRSTNAGGTWSVVTTGTGGTSTTYVTESTTAPMNGYMYRATFTNSAGSVTSSSATLTVDSSTPPPVSDGHLWINHSYLMALPTTGSPGWSDVVAAANGSWGSTDLYSLDGKNDIYTLAGALVGTRLNDAALIEKTRASIRACTQTTHFDRALELGRNIQSYIFAADIVGLSTADETAFKNFLLTLPDMNTNQGHSAGGATDIYNTALYSANNWGGHCRAACIAIYLYCGGNESRLTTLTNTVRAWCGETASNVLVFNNTTWHVNPSTPKGINPRGSTRDGHNIDGVLPEDERRSPNSDTFSWPPGDTNYVCEGLQGALVSVVLLSRANRITFQVGDDALNRAFYWQTYIAGYPFTTQSDDTWQLFVMNKIRGTNYPTSPNDGGMIGKNMAWTEWTHQPGSLQPGAEADGWTP